MAIYVPGPCPIYLGVGDNAGTPRHLGFAERGIHIEFDHQFQPYHVDVGGSQMLDNCFQGTTARISAVITNWIESTYVSAADVSGNFTFATFRGIEQFSQIGVMMGYEGAAYPMWIPFPYSTKIAYSSTLMPLGYHFFSVHLIKDSLPERGARPAKLDLTWQALRAVSNNAQSVTDLTLSLYDHDMTAVSGLPLS